MESEWLERDSDYLFVEGQSTDELQSPLKRSTRLKYNCVSVSNKLVAFGSNTGGIYIFSRVDQKLLQIAFAEKETNSVWLVKISPHEKYVAFVSSGNVYVLDLKLDSRSKAETLRSTSDLAGRLVTSLLWDQSSAKLYIGDDLGKVSMMPVYSNKAKNLFSLPLEVIMKLDSAIVQMDKAEDKILVSTVTRCYLCDTIKQSYSQIGKKLRDGNFGACFLRQGTSAPMVYSARPGSRIWEVDYEGNVLNTHQFKQLLAVPSSHILRLDQKYRSQAENNTAQAQSVAFPKLIVLRNDFLLTWNSSSVFVLDPINVKVILWTNELSGIQDICCLGKEIYVFFESMKLQCISFQPVTSVVPQFIQANDLESAALLCIHHRNVFLHRHVRKKFGVNELNKIFDKLVSEKMEDLADQIHEVIVNIENKIADESENEASSSGRSRSGSALSGSNVAGVPSGGVNNAVRGTSCAITEKNEVDENTGGADSRNAQRDIDINENFNESSKLSVTDGADGEKKELEILCSGETIETKALSKTNNPILTTGIEVEGFENTQRVKDMLANGCDIKLDKVESMQNNQVNGENFKEKELTGKETVEGTNTNREELVTDSLMHSDTDLKKDEKVLPSFQNGRIDNKNQNLHGKGETELTGDSSEQTELETQSKHLLDGSKHEEPNVGVSETLVAKVPDVFVDIDLENGDDLGFLPSVGLGMRRLSLTSLSSVDSVEVSMDQPFPNDFDDVSDKIATPVKRKSNKKKSRRRASAFEIGETKIEARTTRSQSLGTPDSRERALSPQGSVRSVKEEDSISLYSNESILEEGGSSSMKDLPEGLHTNKSAETMSIDSPLSNSEEFGRSGEFSKSEEYLHNGEYSPGETTLSRSWEKNKQSSSAPKTALLQLKNKMQTKMTSGTKNLIRNIKEKNLLTKAKVFAENLSQGSEAYLHSGEGQFNETPDILMTHEDFEHQMKEPQIQVAEQMEDTVDGVDKVVVDLTDLEQITMETKEKMQEIEVITDPEAVYSVLLDWITVLNRTFQELHIKKYGETENDKNDKNGLSASSDKANSSSAEFDKVVENCDEHHKPGKTSSNSDTCALIGGNKTKIDTPKPERNSGSLINILSDKTFCHLTDPLSFSLDLFQDICELAQACFDIGCHGNILKSIEFQFHAVNNSEISNTEPESEKKFADSDDINIQRKDAQVIEKTENSIDIEVECDTNHSCDNAGHLDIIELKEDDDKSEVEIEALNSTSEGEHNTFETEVSEKQSLVVDEQTAVLDEIENAEKEQSAFDSNSCETNGHTDVDRHSMGDCKESAKPNATSTTSVEDKEDGHDKAMGWFVRCYFPYLSVYRVRETTLRGKCYHLWSALITCMEGKAKREGGKYGIDNKRIIQYLLDNQANTDQGAMLLGHISELFYSSLGSVVDVCVRCHPFVHPLDVMYMCKCHLVTMETVFKQYMIWMTMDETSSIKKQILLDVGKHLEVVMVWLDLLLSEDVDSSLVIDENGCPRCMAHKIKRKNEALIEQFTSHIQTAGDQHAMLELFRKHGYWVGVLKMLKKTGPRSDHLELVLQLGDVDLVCSSHDLAFEPRSVSDWQQVLAAYQKLSETWNQTTQEVSCDWSKLITWDNLAVLLVRHVGSEEALALLEMCDVAERVLSPEFYQVCLLSGMVQRQQRLVLHSMLEKVDSYLWSQRPTALSPQVQYVATFEKKAPSGETASSHTDILQSMVGSLKERQSFEQYVEDPECHWGIETKINLLCPCCYISLKETVSHDEPGVLIFRCGHGFHKFCLPRKECMSCDRDSKGETSEKAFYI